MILKDVVELLTDEYALQPFDGQTPCNKRDSDKVGFALRPRVTGGKAPPSEAPPKRISLAGLSKASNWRGQSSNSSSRGIMGFCP